MRSLLVAFTLLAIGCAALFYPDEYLTTGFYTAAMAVFMFALSTAFVSTGAARARGIGYAVFGGVYFLAAFYGDLQPNYQNEYTFRLITSTFLISIDGWLNHLQPQRGANFAFTELHVTLPIGHAVFTVFAGLIGGAVAEWLWRRRGAG